MRIFAPLMNSDGVAGSQRQFRQINFALCVRQLGGGTCYHITDSSLRRYGRQLVWKPKDFGGIFDFSVVPQNGHTDQRQYIRGDAREN